MRVADAVLRAVRGAAVAAAVASCGGSGGHEEIRPETAPAAIIIPMAPALPPAPAVLAAPASSVVATVAEATPAPEDMRDEAAGRRKRRGQGVFFGLGLVGVGCGRG